LLVFFIKKNLWFFSFIIYLIRDWALLLFFICFPLDFSFILKKMLSHLLTSGCLIIKFHCFIKITFNGVASISQLGHRFCMCNQDGLFFDFFWIVCFFNLVYYEVIMFSFNFCFIDILYLSTFVFFFKKIIFWLIHNWSSCFFFFFFLRGYINPMPLITGLVD